MFTATKSFPTTTLHIILLQYSSCVGIETFGSTTIAIRALRATDGEYQNKQNNKSLEYSTAQETQLSSANSQAC